MEHGNKMKLTNQEKITKLIKQNSVLYKRYLKNVEAWKKTRNQKYATNMVKLNSQSGVISRKIETLRKNKGK